MAIGRNAHPTAPDVRLTVQSATRPASVRTTRSGHVISIAPNPLRDLFRPYHYAGPTPVESLVKAPKES